MSYYGVVATRCQHNLVTTSLDTTNKQMMQRSVHKVRGHITKLKVIPTNFYLDNTFVEKAPGAAATVSTSFEYPIDGPCTPFLFSGSVDGNVPDGGVAEDCALLNVDIPDGASIGIREWRRCAAGIIVGAQSTISGDRMIRGVSGIADQTLGGIIGSGTAAAVNFPLGIVGLTDKASDCLIGDSVALGLGMSPDANGERGIITALSPSHGYVNLTQAAVSLSDFLASYTQRRKIFQYCSHFINELGIGDLYHGDTVAQLEAKLLTLYGGILASNPAAKIFQTTFAPQTETTDACTSLGNQTLRPLETPRLASNDRIRNGLFGPNAGMFDITSVLGTGSNNSFWITAPQYSFDCSHPSAVANTAMESTIDLSRFVVSPPSWFKRA